MKTIAILAIVGVAALAMFSMTSGVNSGVESQFQTFLSRHGVNYGTTEEYNFRLGVFQENLDTIARLNAENPRATFAVNKFADRTPAEMKKRMGIIIPAGTKTTGPRTSVTGFTNADWSHMWSSIKDQGQCGSCWAFSAAAAFEARYVISQGATHVNILYAEQELVDCEPRSNGCQGGWMDYAFTYLQNNVFCTEDQYPYTAFSGTCNASACSRGPNDKTHYDISPGDEAELLNALVDGPVSVTVDANSWAFYSGGILDTCGTSLDHGVTLIKSSSYEGSVTIRNSWGDSWGENGLIRLAVNKNMCGYANAASYPIF